MIIITADDGTDTPVTVVPVEPKEQQFRDARWYADPPTDRGRYRALLDATDPSMLGAVIEMRRALEDITTAYVRARTAQGCPAADLLPIVEVARAALSRIREATDV